MSSVSLVPLPSEQAGASCSNCAAALAEDQRYCLSCGQPCSPVRLAFLDVLQEDNGRGRAGAGQGFAPAASVEMSPFAFAPPLEPGAGGWLRRNSGLMGLLSVLLLCLLVGLLVGHWVTQGAAKTPARQVVEVKGLSGLASAAATTTPTTPAVSETPAASSSAKQAAAEAKAAAKETAAEKAPPPKPVKVAPAKLKKLSSTHGKQHQEEINSLGAQPIETG